MCDVSAAMLSMKLLFLVTSCGFSEKIDRRNAKMSQKTTLPETDSSHLKMDGWNTFSFPFGILRIFRGVCC